MKSEETEHDVDDSGQEHEYSVIPVQLYESVSLPTHVQGVGIKSDEFNNSKSSKYYKQTYRQAWEQMPDFKGWLRGVEGEPTRAFCTYCRKTLHAHRLSLLKHTCTIRHQKAAQLHVSRKGRMSAGTSNDSAELDENSQSAEFAEDEYSDQEDQELEEQQSSEPGSEQTLKNNTGNQQKSNLYDKPPISTHVTDMTKGKPIGGLQVSLYKLIDGRWTFINEGITQPDGKFSQFIERCDFTSGRYKLHFDVDRYFESKNQPTIYPFIEVVFNTATFSDSHHIPLILSPFGYSTYKG